MNERERAVCSRLKPVREEVGISQPAFAERLGVTLDQWASVEYGRMPLRYSLGHWLCHTFDLNQRWIAEGKTPKEYFVELGPEASNIPPNMLFSKAYDHILKPFVEADLKGVAKMLRRQVRDIAGIDARAARPAALVRMSRQTFDLLLAREMRAATKDLRQSSYLGFYAAVNKFRRDFLKRNPHSTGTPLRWTPLPEFANERKDVDATVTSGKVEDMKAQWPGLLARLKKATEARGVASALARELQVPLASVSRWIGGKRLPSGDIALKLLRWVERQEAK